MRLPPTMSGSIQTAATDPPEEASPSGLVRFHALGLHPTPLVSILIDRNLHLMSHAYLNSPPRYSADRFRPHRHTDKGRPVKGGPSSMWDIFLFGWLGDTLLPHSDSVILYVLCMPDKSPDQGQREAALFNTALPVLTMRTNPYVYHCTRWPSIHINRNIYCKAPQS